MPVYGCRSTASSVAEAKDAELERVLASNAELRQDLAALQHMRMVRYPPLPLMHSPLNHHCHSAEHRRQLCCTMCTDALPCQCR